MADTSTLKGNMLEDPSQGPQPQPAEQPQQGPGFFGGLAGSIKGMFSGAAPSPEAAAKPDGTVDTKVEQPKPADAQQLASAVEQDPAKAQGAKTAFTTMTSSLPVDMREGLQAEYAALEKKREDTRNNLAWVEGLSMLAQLALKMHAAHKSIKSGVDYTSGIEIPTNQFSGAYKSLEADYDRGLKDIQFRTELAFRGQEAASERAFKSEEAGKDRASRADEVRSREKLAGQEIRSREGIARSERIQRMQEFEDKSQYDKKMLELKELELGGKGAAKLTPEQYTDKMLTIDALETKANAMISNPQTEGLMWTTDSATTKQFFTDIGVDTKGKDVHEMNSNEKADLQSQVTASLARKKSMLNKFKPGESAPVSAAPSAPSAESAAPSKPGQGGYEVGKKYQGKTYLGGDPKDVASWR